MKTTVLTLALVLAAVVPNARGADLESPPVLLALQQDLTSALKAMDADVARVVRRLRKSGLFGKAAENALGRLCAGHASAVDCTAVDPKGIMRLVAPAEYKRFQGSDIGDQEQIQRLRQTKRPVLSAAFRAVEGFDAMDLEHPVLGSKGRLLGSVSLLFRPEKLIAATVGRRAEESGWEVWVLETGGRFLYGTLPVSIGKNLMTDSRYQPFPSLVALGQRIVREPSGSGSYEFGEPGQKSVTKRGVWTTVELHGTPWRLLVTRTGP